MNENKEKPSDEAADLEFLKWVGSLWESQGFAQIEFGESIARALRGDRSISRTLGAATAFAIWDRHYQPPKNENFESSESFWQGLGKALNEGKPLPAGTDRERFKELFLARLGFRPVNPPSSELVSTDGALLELFFPYLGSEANLCWQLVTRGINLHSGTKALRLAQVYVSLDTKSPRPRQSDATKHTPDAERDLSALEVLFDQNARRVVLVGEPGSGKSTFLQFVLLYLTYKHSSAQDANFHFAGLDERKEKALEILREQQDKMLPFRIILRNFATTADGTARDIVQFLEGPLRNLGYKEAADQLNEALQRGLAFVLFDGLDEVPRSHLSTVKKAIEAFAQGTYGKCRIAVTCRTESYKKPEFKLADFSEPHEIAPLSSALQTEFVRAWYKELEQAQPQFFGQGDACAVKLISALTNERLQEMAGNPFFLTVMAALHRPDTPLPDAGAKLMNELVNSVLEESRRLRPDMDADGKTPEPELTSLLKRASIGIKELRSCLEAIAYCAREKRQDKVSRFVDDDLLRHRLAMSDKVKVDDLLDALRHRAGLLQSQDGKNFEFAYRFEEFLAGCYLAKSNAWVNVQPHFHLRALDLLDKQGDYARQVVIWAAGFIAHVQSDEELKVQALVLALLPKEDVDDESSLTRLELAADIAHDARMANWLELLVPGKDDALRRLRASLERVRDDEDRFQVKSRARAASAIGRLGDPRPGVGIIETEPKRPDIVWCGGKGEVIADKSDLLEKAFPILKVFKIGEPKGRKERAFGSFRQFDCTRIAKPFFISKFPVTVAQYQMFVEAKGYEQQNFWTEAGWEWRTGRIDTSKWESWWRDDYEKEEFPITGPKRYTAVFQTPNHPRIGISWFEAWAYCAWLNSPEIQSSLVCDLGLSKDFSAKTRLPAEAEWELAARWNKDKGEADDRLFPWGNEKTEAALTEGCNWGGAKIESTSAVGLFPKGRADCGAADLAGNVWEWCQTKWINPDDKNTLKQYNSGIYDEDDGDGARVLRGGSWGNGDPGGLRSSGRNDGRPGSRGNGVGFRVVCVGASAR
jgi:formylglycine-generating enzyme required for sulfatase activity